MGIHITNRDGTTVDFCTDKIVDAIAKVSIRAEEKKVEKEIRAIDLFSGIGGMDIGDAHSKSSDDNSIESAIHVLCKAVMVDLEESMKESYEQYLEHIAALEESDYLRNVCLMQLRRERLEKRRKELRELRKLKTARVSALLKAAWLNRNSSVGRSSTSAVTDLMLISLPVPPTSVTANCSLRYGGAVIATK